MGLIHDLRQELSDVPGAHQLIMNYEDGGRVQVFTMGDISARVGPMATSAEIKAALLAEVAKR